VTTNDEPPPWEIEDEDQDDDDTCPFCGRDATDEYEGQAYCGRDQCRWQLHVGIDYINERG
jgi:hypothetical protein